MASGQSELSRHEALAILGVQEGVSTADLRRAFKARALQSHPDKTRQHVSASDAAFKRLVSAYQCLTQPAAAKTWAELDMSDILSDAFFAEAFAQELPAFEMMYIHTHMPSAPGQVAMPSPTPPPHHHHTSSAVACPAAALKADMQPPDSTHPDTGQHQLPCSEDTAGQQVLPLHGSEQLKQKEEEGHSYTEQQQGQQQGQQQQGQPGMVSSVSQAVQGPMPRIWADELPSQTGLRDATWRRIHEAVQRKAEKARARAAGQVPSKPHRRFLHRQAQRWSLLWALLADLLRPDPAAFVLVDEQERIVCIAPSTSSGPSRALVPFEQPGRQQRLQASLQGEGLQLAAQPAACAGGGAGMVCLDSVAQGLTLTRPGKLGPQAGLLNAMPEPDAGIGSQGCGAAAAAAVLAAAGPGAPAAVRERATVGAGVGTAAAKEEPTTAGPGEGEVTSSAESTVDAAPEAKAPAAGQSGASSSVHVIPVTTFIALPRHKQRHALAARPASGQPPVLEGCRQPSATSSQQHGHGSDMSGSECGATAVLALYSAVPGQKDVAVPGLDLTTLRRRTSLRFYWMWAKRMLVAKAVLMLLRQR